MECKRGIYIKSESARRPCGQCMACRINKGRLWSSRIMMETVTHHDYSWFVTLTYNQDALPTTLDSDGAPVPTLEKKTFLKWINNQMSDLGNFRYYAVGEYGDLSGRPHYHLALFPESFGQLNALRHNWKEFGFTSCADMQDKRARYLAGYTTKKLTSANDDRLQGNQQPEWRTSSRRPPLGTKFAEMLVEHYSGRQGSKIIAERGDIERSWRHQGRTYPLGDWVLKKVRTELGIPILHRDRQVHPEYLNYHEIKEASWKPNEAIQQEKHHDGKKRQKLYRSSIPRL